ncbi:unnamed protein product [Thelazia callipaeda]|uniref:Ras family protein n=1 Tax=Thelazia callipaeda TaxID=103827 RepID=A0A0N5D8I6_THECL|nr:unnamed protein product [Thelazia callipaeda]
MPEYKIVVLGSEGVGKSSLITQLVKKMFVKRYDPTIEDNYKHEFVANEKTCTLLILDTAGTEQFSAMYDLYMKYGDGFIIVYSVTDLTSLANTVGIFQNLVRMRQKYHFPLILVGNKCDDNANRQVSRRDGEQFAAQYNSTFCETSAKTNIHVIETFEDIVKQIRMEEQLSLSQFQSKIHPWHADTSTSMCCFM